MGDGTRRDAAGGIAVGDELAEEPPPGESGPPAPSQPWPKASTGWIAVFFIMLATTMNFLDGGVFSLMIELVKLDFGLSDVQVGLLLGPANIVFYLFFGILLARLVDIYPRRIILSLGLVVTSGVTALGGIVQNYGQLFASRMFIGVGGSAHAPGAYSMIADYFPPKKLPRAIAGIQFGFIFGLGFAQLLGGALLGMVAGWGTTEWGPFVIRNWQWVLIMVGIPGVLIAACIFMLPEPPRRGKVTEGKALPIRDVFKEIWRRKAVYGPLFAGLAVSSIEAGGLGQWRAPFMMRTYGWSPELIGYWSGVTLLVFMPIGLFLGTWLAEWYGKRYPDANVRVTVIMFAAAVPFSVASPLMPTGELAIILGAIGGVFGIASAVPQNAAIQTITPNEMRGQVTAVYLFMFTVFGALGSLFIATFNELVIGEEDGLWKTMAITAAILMPLAAWIISRGVRPYGREVEKLQAEGVFD